MQTDVASAGSNPKESNICARDPAPGSYFSAACCRTCLTEAGPSYEFQVLQQRTGAEQWYRISAPYSVSTSRTFSCDAGRISCSRAVAGRSNSIVVRLRSCREQRRRPSAEATVSTELIVGQHVNRLHACQGTRYIRPWVRVKALQRRRCFARL